MKGLTKWIITAVFLILCIHTVSAFSVSSITVEPSGSLTPATPVIVTFVVDMTASGDETFPSADELQMSTDLDSAKWSYSLVLDGVDTVQPANSGRVLSVSGWVLSYPSGPTKAPMLLSKLLIMGFSEIKAAQGGHRDSGYLGEAVKIRLLAPTPARRTLECQPLIAPRRFARS